MNFYIFCFFQRPWCTYWWLYCSSGTHNCCWSFKSKPWIKIVDYLLFDVSVLGRSHGCFPFAQNLQQGCHLHACLNAISEAGRKAVETKPGWQHFNYNKWVGSLWSLNFVIYVVLPFGKQAASFINVKRTIYLLWVELSYLYFHWRFSFKRLSSPCLY